MVIDKQPISIQQAIDILEKLVGLKVNRAWHSIYTYIFLELGDLHYMLYHSPKGIKETWLGEWTLEVGGKWLILPPEAPLPTLIDAKGRPNLTDLSVLEGRILEKLIIDEHTFFATFHFTDGWCLHIQPGSAGVFVLTRNHYRSIEVTKDGVSLKD